MVMNEESQIEVRSAPGLIGVDGEHVQAKAVKIVGAVARFVVVVEFASSLNSGHRPAYSRDCSFRIKRRSNKAIDQSGIRWKLQ